ncbi:hypothetical protein ACFZAM_31560 [Streptomyces sp. NPDC008079]|uniref:hypothetical protein n=1 Tax=Streptomyces sp. NPDC008079 TaxID=3364806 RepID=UPI0036E35C07
MKSKKETVLTVTFVVEHSDGPNLTSYEPLATHLAQEWEGHEVYFQAPDEEDETSVHLYVRSAEVTTTD